MRKDKIIEYMKIVLELEKNKYETERIISNLKAKQYIATYKVNNASSIGAGTGCMMTGASILIGAFVGWIISAIIGSAALGNDMEQAFLPGIVIGAICGLIGSLLFIKSDINAVKTAKVNTEQYNNDNKSIADNQNKIISVAVNEATRALEHTEYILQDIYSKNVIYGKYRNIVAISSFLEYFESGRCETLEGADGAYNIYETESRLDKIITRLDIIISNLEQIKQNQYRLYSAIKEITPQIQNLTNQIERNTEVLNMVAVNTAMTEYTTKVIERNQYYNRTFYNTWTF